MGVRMSDNVVMIGTAVEYDIALPITPKKSETVPSMGYQIVKTFVIHESEVVDRALQYELLMDDEPYVWSGPEEEREDGLLNIVMKILGQEPEIPNN
jgi:hypothetical protein